MLVMQILLADIVWRTARDWRCVIVAVLLPEAAIDYGLLMTKTVPDTALIAFSMAMVWALVRLALSNDLRWWLLAGVFGGCALLSKYIAILLLPAIVAYAVLPPWRKTQLSSPYPWLAALLALLIFSPVLYWNAIHDWESFRFQINRPTQTEGLSWKFLAEFVGTQFLLLGPMLFPVVLIGTARLGRRGLRLREPITILLTMCVACPLGFLLIRSLYGRIGDSWPLFIWPFGFACAAINLKFWRQDAPTSSLARIAPAAAIMTILTGIALVVPVMIYYTAGARTIWERAIRSGKKPASPGSSKLQVGNATRQARPGSRRPTTGSIRCCDGTSRTASRSFKSTNETDISALLSGTRILVRSNSISPRKTRRGASCGQRHQRFSIPLQSWICHGVTCATTRM